MKSLLLLLIFTVTSINISAKDILEQTKLSNGKTIIVYTDHTWEYKKASTSQQTTISDLGTSQSAETNTSNSVRSSSSSSRGSYQSNSTSSSLCGARTKKGGSCQRRVAGGGYCWQHR